VETTASVKDKLSGQGDGSARVVDATVKGLAGQVAGDRRHMRQCSVGSIGSCVDEAPGRRRLERRKLELAVTFAVNSTKMGEGSSSGGRLSRAEERTLMILLVFCIAMKKRYR
jgi:hypothetical protein